MTNLKADAVDSKGAAIDSEEIWLNILNKLPKEIRELVGKHSVHWNYSKIETLDALSAILAQEVKRVIGEDEPIEPHSITELGNSARNDLRAEQRRKAGLV